MGKSKKKVNVFKVAGAKSLKLKAKAKTVKSELKQINAKNKTKIMQMDKELVNLEEKIRNPVDKEKKRQIQATNKLPQVNINKKDIKGSEEAINQISAMQL